MAKEATPKSKVKITAALIREILHTGPTGRRETFRDTLCPGFILRQGANGGLSYGFDYYDPNGKRQTYTFPEDPRHVDPGEIRKKIRQGLGPDPAGEKRAVRNAAKLATERTARAFLEGRYWNDKLQNDKSGKATQQRIAAAWGPLLDADMASLDPAEFVAHRQERLDEEIAPQTLNRDRIALLGMLNRAVEWEIIDSNPLDVPAFKPLTEEDGKRVRWLGQRDEHEEVLDEYGAKVGERVRFMEALGHPETPDYLRDMCVLALNTGLRRGEMFQLRWFNVMTSARNPQLTIAAGTTKTNKVRHVPLNETAKALLTRLGTVRHISGLVFPNPETGEPFTTVKKAWRTLVQRARLDDFVMHDCRHDFASRLVQDGESLYVVRDLLGHASIKTTERYAHLAPNQKDTAVKRLDRLAAA